MLTATVQLMWNLVKPLNETITATGANGKDGKIGINGKTV